MSRSPAPAPAASRIVPRGTQDGSRGQKQKGASPNAIVIEDRVRIPAGLDSLEAFRNWARSEEFPEHGRYAYLDGETRVDLSMEQPYTHNRVKTKITTTLDALVDEMGSGEVFADGILLTNVTANLSTEPDLMFVSFEALRSRPCPFRGSSYRWFQGNGRNARHGARSREHHVRAQRHHDAS
jgi:Putative restriction endonuclease